MTEQMRLAVDAARERGITTKDEAQELALPCPFCGEKPRVTQYTYPGVIEVKCINEDCAVYPQVEESVSSLPWEDGGSFCSMYELHYQPLIAKWNKRA